MLSAFMRKPVANISGRATREFLSGRATSSRRSTLEKLAGLFSQAISNCRRITVIANVDAVGRIAILRWLEFANTLFLWRPRTSFVEQLASQGNRGLRWIPGRRLLQFQARKE